MDEMAKILYGNAILFSFLDIRPVDGLMERPPMDARPAPNPPRRLAILTCAVLEREMRHFAAGRQNVAHIHVIDQGLHDEPDRLRATLADAITQIERQHEPDAILLGYGLCSRGIEGITTTRATLVICRAHDCITLLLGCRKRYADYVAQHPGTYWYSPGWIEHSLMPGKQRYDRLYEQYRQRFGPDDARYLMDAEQGWFASYSRATFVDLSIGATDDHVAFTRRCADWLKWEYDRQHGDPALIEALLDGEWDEKRFCVLAPGQTIRLTADARVIEVCDA
jgi:hypothetical protein